jgi:hypothetical protein
LKNQFTLQIKNNQSAAISESTKKTKRPNMTKLSPKAVTLAQIVLAPVCFLATAVIQHFQLVENLILPILYYFFLPRNILFVMIGIVFVWTYVITASLSVIAQAACLEQECDNDVCIKKDFFFLYFFFSEFTSL